MDEVAEAGLVGLRLLGRARNPNSEDVAMDGGGGSANLVGDLVGDRSEDGGLGRGDRGGGVKDRLAEDAGATGERARRVVRRVVVVSSFSSE